MKPLGETATKTLSRTRQASLHVPSSELYAIAAEITPTGFRMLPRALVSALAAESVCLRRKSSAAARDQTVVDQKSRVL